ncbi:hypothetical protein RP20_CCG006673 [Aedes albopictus]|nr:hypothetical protein RP20_CCG006673 [Aedes albopictus]
MAHGFEFREDDLPMLFFDIRVDHLNEDELDFELEVRNIVFENRESMSRKRRALRERLKSEKLEGGIEEFTWQRDPQNELVVCGIKFQEIEGTVQNSVRDLPPRCQSSLLHLGNRIKLLKKHVEPEDTIQLDVMQEKVLIYLRDFFYHKRQSEDMDLRNLFTEQLPAPENQAQAGNTEAVEADVLGSLRRLGLVESGNPDSEGVREGLLRLEHELYLLRKFKETHSGAPATSQALNIMDAELPSVSKQVTYTGTIPKNSVSGTPAIARHLQFRDPAASCLYTQSGPANPGQQHWGESSHFERIFSRNSDPSHSVDCTSAGYPAINTITNPTPTMSAPRMATSISSRAGSTWTPRSTDYKAASSTHPPYFTTGAQLPTYSGRTSENWKMIPFGWSEGYYNPSSSAPTHAPERHHGPGTIPGSWANLPVTSTLAWSSQANPGMITSAASSQLPTNSGGCGPIPMVGPLIPGDVGIAPPPPTPSVGDYFPRPYQRKSLPVSKWKLEKYAGTDQGLKLNEFLHLVSQLALSESVSESELFDSAFHLFTGPSLNWYMSMRSTGRLVNWTHLVFELRKAFVHPELDSLVRARIYQRRQARNETFQDFYYEMESMFRSMSNPMAEWEKVDVLRRNMRTDYKKALLWKPIANLSELLEAGHLIDASNFSLFAKMYGTEKSANVVSFNHPQREEKKQSSRLPASSKSQEKSYFKNKTTFSRKDGNFEMDSKPASTSNKSLKVENPGEGSSKPKRTLDYLVEGYKPPRDNECLYCRLTNHVLEQCRSQKGLMCLVCGFRGFDTQHCPYCKKTVFRRSKVADRRTHTPTRKSISSWSNPF